MTSPYWSRFASSLSPYVPGEQPRDRKFIKLNTNENPYPPSPKVIKAIGEAANESLRLYPDPSCTALREAVASRWNINAGQVFAGNGSDEILAFAFAAFFNGNNSNTRDSKADPVRPVLFPDVTYSFYPVYAALWNIPYRTPALDRDFALNPNDYKCDCGGVILSNPNAPTGRALDVETLRTIARELEKHKKVFIIDEAYIAFADDNSTGTMIPFINEHPNLLIIRTLSKDASLAGLRAGYAVGSAEIIEGLCRIRDSFNSYTTDRLAQAAAAAAIADTAYYDEINTKIRETRNRVASALCAINFRVIPSQANFVFASPQSIPAVQVYDKLRERGILVRHFKKPKTENFLRITIGSDMDMDTFLNACGHIIAG